MSNDVKHPWVILGVIALSVFMTNLDGTVIQVALPTIANELEVSGSTLGWTVDAYLLTFGTLLLLGGSFSDRYGRRLSFMLGMLLFGIASAAAGLAQEPWQLIVARGAQGLGGALIMPPTLVTIKEVFPEKTRGKAIAIWTAASALGMGTGPLVGGELVESAGWRWVFWINLPVVVIALLGAAKFVPESKDAGQDGKFDVVGAVLSTLAVASVLFALIEAPSEGIQDPLVFGTLLGGIVLAVAFAKWELSREHPMLDLRLFRNGRFASGTATSAVVFLLLLGTVFLMTQYLQDVQGRGAAETGRLLLWFVGGMLLTALTSSVLIKLAGVRSLVTLGGVAVTVGLVGLARLDVDSSASYLAIWLFIGGMGVGLAMAPSTNVVMAALPPGKTSVASAVNAATRTLGGAVGVALLPSIASFFYRHGMEDDVAALPAAEAEAASDRVGAAVAIAGQPGRGALQAAATQEFVSALTWAMLAGAAIALAIVAIARGLTVPTRRFTGTWGLVEKVQALEAAMRRVAGIQDAPGRATTVTMTLGLHLTPPDIRTLRRRPGVVFMEQIGAQVFVLERVLLNGRGGAPAWIVWRLWNPGRDDSWLGVPFDSFASAQQRMLEWLASAHAEATAEAQSDVESAATRSVRMDPPRRPPLLKFEFEDGGFVGIRTSIEELRARRQLGSVPLLVEREEQFVALEWGRLGVRGERVLVLWTSEDEHPRLEWLTPERISAAVRGWLSAPAAMWESAEAASAGA